jgi:hypothetical protein
MSAVERMVVSEMGYEKGIGAMSADASARMAVRKNRVKIGNAWVKKYAEFESYDGMPKIGTRLYNWQSQQLGNTRASCLNAKIREVIE